METMTYNNTRQIDKYSKRGIGNFTAFLFLSFIFLILTGSSLRLGSIQLRYIFALFLIFDAVLIGLRFNIDKTVLVFIAFIFSFGFSCVLTGYVSNFISQLYYAYFIAIFGCVFVMALLKRDAYFIRQITYLILAIGAFDVVVTYSQFLFNDDWYRPIEQMLNLPVWDVMEEVTENKSSRMEAMDMTLPGILGNGVYNGYFLSVCAVLSMIFVIRTKNSLLYVFPLFYILGSFMCQQRGPLFISLFVIAMISLRLFKEFSSRSRIVLFAFLAVGGTLAVSLLSNMSELLNLRYSSTGFDSTGRNSIAANTMDYIMSHPIIANAYELLAEKGHMPHNFFLNAFIYGGIISFFLIMYILIIQFKTFLKIVKSNVDGLNAYYYVFAWAWAAFTLNCLLHNRSIITGDYLIWLIWGVMLSSPLLKSTSSIVPIK